jgi:hypothetical protein
MRFDTQHCYDGALSDEEAQTVHSRCAVHRDALRSKFPATVIALAYGVYLHDGRVRRSPRQDAQDTDDRALGCGDLQLVYFDLGLVYQEVSMTESKPPRFTKRECVHLLVVSAGTQIPKPHATLAFQDRTEQGLPSTSQVKHRHDQIVYRSGQYRYHFKVRLN